MQRRLSFQRSALTGLVTGPVMAHEPAPLGNVGNRLQPLRAAIKTFGPVPLSSMIKTLQSSKLRKHLLVRLCDLW